MSICMSVHNDCKIKSSRNYSCIRFNTFQLVALQETVEMLQLELHGTKAELMETRSELHGAKTEIKETQSELHGAKAEIFELKKEDQIIIAALQSQQTFQMS